MLVKSRRASATEAAGEVNCPSHVIIAESEQLHTLIGRKYRYFDAALLPICYTSTESNYRHLWPLTYPIYAQYELRQRQTLQISIGRANQRSASICRRISNRASTVSASSSPVGASPNSEYTALSMAWVCDPRCRITCTRCDISRWSPKDAWRRCNGGFSPLQASERIKRRRSGVVGSGKEGGNAQCLLPT
jgi:hypothetical protein